MRALVIGFGPFLEVLDNPAERLARAVDGARAGSVTVVGRVMPVSYARSLQITQQAVAELRPDLVLGVGVARRRAAAALEVCGRRQGGTLADVDGATCALEGPPLRSATLPAEALAQAIGCGLSDDAGAYVCNAWLYQTLARLPRTPVGFLHIPPTGMPAERLLAGLEAWAGAPGAPSVPTDGHSC